MAQRQGGPGTGEAGGRTIAGAASLGGGSRALRSKRSDLIADEIKRWVIAESKQPGDRLPRERDLAMLFDCGKGTVREALKSLEVQGLISVRPGAQGGATLVEVGYDRATELLRNYLHFRDMTVADIYALRKLVEVEVAVSVVGRLSDEDMAALRENVECCTTPHVPPDSQAEQRQLEIDFHMLLARACTNPLLAFLSRFLNDLLRDFIRFRRDPAEHREFSRSTAAFHRDLLAAYERSDAPAVAKLMTAHMEAAERHSRKLDAVLSDDLFFSRAAPQPGGR